MSTSEWLPTPVGLDAQRWVTRHGCRTVLVVAHTVASCQRLLDVVDYVESDPRVQVVFTVAPDVFSHDVAELVHELQALVIPWHQATRLRFDLALAASYGGLHELHAPLVVMAHGAGFGKVVQPPAGVGPVLAAPTVYGLDAQRLTHNGRVLASALVLAHENQRTILARQCPEALPVAVVAGDPCWDRIVASLPYRDQYRAALGVGNRRKLVVVASTWGTDGAFGHGRDLLPELMTQLPAERYRVGALLHPAVWGAHGRRQIRAWLRDCREAGLILLDADQDWRGLLVAADTLIGDHGSVTAYAAGIGIPVLRLAADDLAAIAAGSAQQRVALAAARLDLSRSLLDQIRAARPADAAGVAAALTSRPGQAGVALREAMYRLLGLPAPGQHRGPRPVPVPVLRQAAA